MEYIALWLALSVVAGVIASGKGRSGIGFFLLAVALSPLIGILGAVAAHPNRGAVEEKRIASGNEVKCPFCAELIKKEAVVCRYCGRDLPKANPEVQPAPDSDEALMKQYGIVHFNDRYLYKTYRYETLEDAVRFARQQQGSQPH